VPVIGPRARAARGGYHENGPMSCLAKEPIKLVFQGEKSITIIKVWKG